MSKHAWLVDISGREHLEEWRPIPEFEGKYEASNLGRIRSKRCILKQRLNRRGYPVVELSHGTYSRESQVHSQVLAAFRGPREPDQECCHSNGIKTDNRLENLRWDTKSANTMDQVAHGTHHHVRKTHCPQGHPYDEDNTVIHAKGSRICRECRRLGLKAHYAANKEKYKRTPEQNARRNELRRAKRTANATSSSASTNS